MGIQVHVGSIASPEMLLFAAALIVAALVGKLACGLGVVTRGVQRLAVGIGMAPRGEVGLIFAGLGTALTLDGQPVLSPAVFSAVVLMVLITTLIAPIGLRWVFTRPSG
jgi:Kef-type K+ transport system membrane component KefB